MKILSIHLIEFGGLTDRHLTLSEGLNIFEGENESGKSTLWLFIKFMLYGMPRKGSTERDRSVSWRGHRACGSMILRHEGEEYRVERSFTESGRSGNDRRAIYRLATGEQVFEGKEAGEVFLGVPREVFESSCGIGQMQLSDLGGKKGAEAIRNLLSSADETADISQIEDKLDKIRVQYRHKNGKGGLLYDLSQERHAIKQRLDRALETEKNLALLEEKMKRTQAQSAQTAERLAKVNDRLTQRGHYELLRRFERLRASEGEREALLAQIEKVKAGAQRTEHLPSDTDAALLRTLADQLRTAQRRREEQNEQGARLLAQTPFDEVEAQMGERIEREGGADAILHKQKKASSRASAGIGAGIGLLAVGAVGIALALTALRTMLALLCGIGGGVATLGVVLLIVGLLAGKQATKIAAAYGKTPKNLAEYLLRCTEALRAQRETMSARTQVEAALRAAEDVEAELRARLCTALARTLPDTEIEVSVEAAEREATRLSGFLSEYNALRAKEAALSQTILSERRALASYDETAIQQSISLAPSELDGIDPVRLETERRFLKTQAEALETGYRASQIELISAKANAENPIELADRQSALLERGTSAEEYYETIELAMQALSDAAQTMSGNITPTLGRAAGELMAYVSDGRYETLTTGSDYTPSLLDRDSFTVNAESLSGGTRDVAYLALRIALVRQIFAGEMPPLMLDEALCQVDDVRIARILSLLGSLCEEEFQCLLFTCHTREARLCEEHAIRHEKISM